MVAGAGLPSILYNHVNRSFLCGRGLFDLAGLRGSAFLMLRLRTEPLRVRPHFFASYRGLCLLGFSLAANGAGFRLSPGR